MATTWIDFDLSEYQNLLVAGHERPGDPRDQFLRLQQRHVDPAGTRVARGSVRRQPGLQGLLHDGRHRSAGTGWESESVGPAAAAGETITINQNTRVIARNFDNVTDRGEQSRIVGVDKIYWSGPLQYDFVTSTTPLVISEINYNPALRPLRSRSRRGLRQ